MVLSSLCSTLFVHVKDQEDHTTIIEVKAWQVNHIYAGIWREKEEYERLLQRIEDDGLVVK